MVVAERADLVHETCPVVINGEGTALRINDKLVLLLEESTGEVVDTETEEHFKDPGPEAAFDSTAEFIPGWVLELVNQKLEDHYLPSFYELWQQPYFCATGFV